MKNKSYNAQSNDIKNSSLNDFMINSNYSDKSKSVLKSCITKLLKVNKILNMNIDNIFTLNMAEFQECIENMRCASARKLGNTLSVLNNLFTWCGENWCEKNGIYNNISMFITLLDRELVLMNSNSLNKFFGREKFEEVIYQIKHDTFNLNIIQYITLFELIYEGYYNSNLTCLYYLNIDNVLDDCIVEEDGEIFEISENLSRDLHELAQTKHWYRANAHNTVSCIPIHGRDENSVFKVEKRKLRSDNSLPEEELFRDVMYRRLRTIFTDYFGDNSLTPYSIFISGIAQRIVDKSRGLGYTEEDVFINTLNDELYKIFFDELERCHFRNCDIQQAIHNIRYELKEYADCF